MACPTDGKNVSGIIKPTLFYKLLKLHIDYTIDFKTPNTCWLVSINHPRSVGSNIECTLKEGLCDSLASVLSWNDRNYHGVFDEFILVYSRVLID